MESSQNTNRVLQGTRSPRHRAQYLRKTSLNKHVKRMAAARLRRNDLSPSPSFIISEPRDYKQSNTPNIKSIVKKPKSIKTNISKKEVSRRVQFPTESGMGDYRHCVRFSSSSIDSKFGKITPGKCQQLVTKTRSEEEVDGVKPCFFNSDTSVVVNGPSLKYCKGFHLKQVASDDEKITPTTKTAENSNSTKTARILSKACISEIFATGASHVKTIVRAKDPLASERKVLPDFKSRDGLDRPEKTTVSPCKKESVYNRLPVFKSKDILDRSEKISDAPCKKDSVCKPQSNATITNKWRQAIDTISFDSIPSHEETDSTHHTTKVHTTESHINSKNQSIEYMNESKKEIDKETKTNQLKVNKSKSKIPILIQRKSCSKLPIATTKKSKIVVKENQQRSVILKDKPKPTCKIVVSESCLSLPDIDFSSCHPPLALDWNEISVLCQNSEVHRETFLNDDIDTPPTKVQEKSIANNDLESDSEDDIVRQDRDHAVFSALKEGFEEERYPDLDSVPFFEEDILSFCEALESAILSTE